MARQEAGGGGELRLEWSARGLAYVLGKHGLKELCPVPAPGDHGAAARVELRIVGGAVKQVRWATRLRRPARPTPGTARDG